MRRFITLCICLALSAVLVCAADVEHSAVKTVDFEAGRRQWAFQPVGKPQPPVLAHDDWSRGVVDRFIFKGLREAGLQPSPQADRRTMIRRVTFDLTGLPPTCEEVEAFMNDKSPEAFAKVVERVLESPHYGEQWARHWLDVARYADTKGYVYAREEKRFVGAWSYRDWVVRSLNDDLPYDRFLLLQIAADQVEPATSPHLAAMGFLTLGRRFLGVTQDIIDDRIDVLMRGTQGLTVSCARCHDHKFDPISIRDYYALYGVFDSSAEKVVPCAPAASDAAFNKELRSREEKLHQMLTLRREEQAARVRAKITEHLIAQLELEKYPEQTFTQIIGLDDINPVFVRRWQAYLHAAEKRADPVFAEWHAAAKSPVAERRKVAKKYGARFAKVEKEWRELLKSNPHATTLPDSGAEALRRVLYGPDSPCEVPDEHLANNEWFFPQPVVVELWKLQGEVDRWLVQQPAAPAYATILVDREEPVTPRVFKRGNPLTKGEEVPRRFLEVFASGEPPPFAKGSGRLELAQGIISPSNPLTARVMVNRVWMQHFGRGLVTTPSDFGKRAEPPSHPELLDWLAHTFMNEGWSLKKLHRRILLSAAYQQSSLGPADTAALKQARDRDPENRLLWRANTHRLGFEEMRDAWLVASGELDLRVGGKPGELLASTRRTLYAHIDRELLPAVMRTFDFANPDLSIPQRNDTIVPQQALFGMNHPFLAARAKALVQRLSGNDTQRVRQLYAWLYQRTPSASELRATLTFVQPVTSPPTARVESSAWKYGIGELDERTGKTKNFTVLPHFNDTAWQGGSQWPDGTFGWAQLTAAGGHPGNDRKHAVVRRWVAPQEGSYAVTSKLIHEPAAGDGIRAFISHSGSGLLRSTTLHKSTAELNVEAVKMSAGETLDFIVDIGDVLNNDQFLWAPQVSLTATAGAGDGTPRTYDAEMEFTSTASPPLTAWQRLAQTMLLTNEFMFID